MLHPVVLLLNSCKKYHLAAFDLEQEATRSILISPPWLSYSLQYLTDTRLYKNQSAWWLRVKAQTTFNICYFTPRIPDCVKNRLPEYKSNLNIWHNLSGVLVSHCASVTKGQVGLSWETLEQGYLSRWKQRSLRLALSDKRVPLPVLQYHNPTVEWLKSCNGWRHLQFVWTIKKIREKPRGGKGFVYLYCMYEALWWQSVW